MEEEIPEPKQLHHEKQKSKKVTTFDGQKKRSGEKKIPFYSFKGNGV